MGESKAPIPNVEKWKLVKKKPLILIPKMGFDTGKEFEVGTRNIHQEPPGESYDVFNKGVIALTWIVGEKNERQSALLVKGSWQLGKSDAEIFFAAKDNIIDLMLWKPSASGFAHGMNERYWILTIYKN